MTTPGGLAAGLAFLPVWLNDAKDSNALDTLLSAWVRASGWRAAGMVWPVDTNPGVQLIARPDGIERLAQIPPELPEVMKSLRTGSITVVWAVPGTSGRLYTLITPHGREPGVIWAERGPGEPWTEAERNYVKLAARLIERSPALAVHIGPVVDPERLQQRLTDASVIAGRMAHDFDNILTGIIGFADLSVPLLPAGSQQAKFVGEISKVGHRGIAFTQQLHQLNRSGQPRPQPASVAAAVAREEARIRTMVQSGVQVVSAIPSQLSAVAIDASPLGVVVGHLLDNAAEATPAHGRIIVSARLVELSPVDAKGYLGQVGPGPHIELTVQDSGPGIKSDVRAKLFADPFYTTKVRHRGLGLAIVYRAVCAHRGGVRIDQVAAPETGTIARIVLPPAAARPAVMPAVQTSPAASTIVI
ncbi:ATP-binding protein [Fimbriiglobus ruber]|uniref:histidine kinase n=1 Tax=Fimbriiglobus ruber TaxID=1908690 RepID=A0A225EDM8_9BACT|nr:ATP-binding protein [Fimbriiglobus ruber]OWK46437.1 diguanylate cyclase/phosphodiesterase (GGDEF & EAL domains) with PAS/PAC sensor(s) [Fimbriiglobus ruber]